MDRDKALELLKEYNKEKFHIQHAITVEKVMEYFAEIENEDPKYWGIVGLLHDIDFEMYPEEHCVKAIEILENNGYDEEFITSVISHGYGICSDVKPSKKMEKILYAVDELTGLIFAASLMRPSKSTKDMKLKSLKKKFKDKSFAAGCSRDTIRNGAEMLNMELDELLENTLVAMQEKEDEILSQIEK
ncbi:HDIG domain-containing metalloprotein [Miniphocaeibacter halophilus]|uniref:HDIG domain-containing protein n=1 Tax=Miniphocaeibacter halophilus TaxID=2931922 RepID=A0AC61MZ31_9FIRM|nr:HDIG domain-containing metalloprotein [Miniphocaeibacter halophilus]QQK07478.1 HDIG domain-containing protein [Miniphocaeibacter halophilus]